MAGFTPEASRRLVESARYVEQQRRNAVARPKGPEAIHYVRLGITTSAITPRSSKTPGSGTVQPYTFGGTTLATSGAAVTVYNWTGSTVATSIWVEFNVVDGYLFLNGTDCSGVAS